MTNYSSNDIAIAIINWNGKHLLEQFLPSITDYSGDATVYIIDNASSDDSIPFIESNYPKVKTVVLDDNYGYAGGYNKGITHISEPIICCLNNDVEVTNAWLDPIIDSFNRDDNCAIMQPKILDYKNRASFEYAGAAGGFVDKYGYPFCRGRLFNAIEQDNGQYNDEREIFWASGACLFIKKEVFTDLNGFDADFFAHIEEIDLCWRAYNTGFKIKYNGNSHVYHVGGSTLKNSNPQKTFLNFRNSLYALLKNTPSPTRLIFMRLLLDGIAGIRFLVHLQPGHFLAIIKAHLSFYKNFSKMQSKRNYTDNKRSNYFKITSAVWLYFVLRIKVLKEL